MDYRSFKSINDSNKRLGLRTCHIDDANIGDNVCECSFKGRSVKIFIDILVSDIINNKYCVSNPSALSMYNFNRKFLTLYHGSPEKRFTPKFGEGEDKHDYGRGFYLTQSKELAKEWAIGETLREGYVHTYRLEITDLSIFNFNNTSSLSWLAELMKHRDADTSIRYKKLSKEFIKKFGIDVERYDVIYGWRADSSYFNIAKRFIRDEIDYDLLDELFKLGDLDNQFCLKSIKAFNNIVEIGTAEPVDISYGDKYMKRDLLARKNMSELIESERNTMRKGFSYVINGGFYDR